MRSGDPSPLYSTCQQGAAPRRRVARVTWVLGKLCGAALERHNSARKHLGHLDKNIFGSCYKAYMWCHRWAGTLDNCFWVTSRQHIGGQNQRQLPCEPTVNHPDRRSQGFLKFLIDLLPNKNRHNKPSPRFGASELQPHCASNLPEPCPFKILQKERRTTKGKDRTLDTQTIKAQIGRHW